MNARRFAGLVLVLLAGGGCGPLADDGRDAGDGSTKADADARSDAAPDRETADAGADEAADVGDVMEGGPGDAQDASATDAVGSLDAVDSFDAGDAMVSEVRDAGDATAADARDASLPPQTPNYLFVTSRTIPFPGLTLAAADAHCNDSAKQAKLPGTFKAWLSTTQVNARDRIEGARGWIRPDGKPFADSLADLVAGRIFYPPMLDETGLPVPARTQVVTGTQAAGVVYGTRNCQDWTATAGTPAANFGLPTATTGRWTHAGFNTCPAASRLYCFGVDHDAPLSPPAAPGNLAFISDAPFVPGNGLSSADALCAREAGANGLPGTFLALLPSSQASAASRFADVAEKRWTRLDGVPLTSPGRDLFTDGPSAPLNVTSRRRYLGTNDDAVFGGAASPTTVPAAHHDCMDWTLTDPASSFDFVTGGLGAANLETWWSTLADGVRCSSFATHVYCLQHDRGTGTPDGGTPDAGAPPAATALNYAFTTSGVYVSQWFSSPLAQADQICNREAAVAGLPGRFVAWIWTSTVAAADRLAGARGWIRPDGSPVADTVADVVAERLRSPLRFDASGNRTPYLQVPVIGLNTSGRPDLSNNCHDWTEASTSDASPCGRLSYLRCFGVDHATPLPTPAPNGHLAFVTDAPFMPGGGLAAADALCASEAQAAGLSGTFAALLPTTTAGAATRFSSFVGPWLRLDGVALNAPGEVLFDQPEPRTDLSLTSKKKTVTSNEFVFTGARTPWALSPANASCSDWTSTLGGTPTGQLGTALYWWRAPGLGSAGCADPLRIYCLQR